jgi:hypothetical protein
MRQVDSAGIPRDEVLHRRFGAQPLRDSHRNDQQHESDRQQPEQVEPPAADAHTRRYSVRSRDRARPRRRVDRLFAERELPAVAADEVGRDARLCRRRDVFRRGGGRTSQAPESTTVQRAGFCDSYRARNIENLGILMGCSFGRSATALDPLTNSRPLCVRPGSSHSLHTHRCG